MNEKDQKLNLTKDAHCIIGYWISRIYSQNLIRIFCTPEDFTAYYAKTEKYREVDMAGQIKNAFKKCIDTNGILVCIHRNDLNILERIHRNNYKLFQDIGGKGMLMDFANNNPDKKLSDNEQDAHQYYGEAAFANLFLIIDNFNLNIAKDIIMDATMFELVARGYHEILIIEKVKKIVEQLVTKYNGYFQLQYTPQ